MEGSQSVVGTESVVFQNETPWNATIPAMSEGLSHQFIYSVYAQIVSGFFVWIALILTCLQVRSSFYVSHYCTVQVGPWHMLYSTDPNTVFFRDNGTLVDKLCHSDNSISLSHTLSQIFQHLRYYTVPEQQLWIVRILFIIPIYGLCSWVGLIWPGYSVYFDSIRSCYEAFVIYNFLRLCLAYLGGEASVLSDINGQPIQ